MSLSELLGRPRHLLAERVAHPGCDIGASARQRANQRTHYVAAQLLAPVLHDHSSPAAKEVAHHSLWNGLHARGDDEPKNLRYGEEADHRGNEVHAAGEFSVAEGEAGHARGIVQPDSRHEEANEQA